MKIIVLGFSSLEHDLVEKFDLKNLKQKEYGKIQIPLNGLMVDPSPVLVWTSFITGKKPGEFGFDNTVVYNRSIKPLISFYYSIRKKKLYENVLQRDEDKKTTDYLSKKLLKYHLAVKPSKKNINCATLFDLPNMIHENLPVLDSYPEYNNEAKKSMLSEEDKQKCEHKWKEEFEKQKKEVFSALSNDWSLYMNHFYILDGIQHIYYDNELKIRTYYLYVDSFIQDVLKSIGDYVLLLIVSDCGKKNGLYTNHGFYSINKKMNLNNIKMIDFKDLIENNIKTDIKNIFEGGVL